MKKPKLDQTTVQTGEIRIVVGIDIDGLTAYNFATDGLSMSEAVYVLERVKHDQLHHQPTTQED